VSLSACVCLCTYRYRCISIHVCTNAHAYVYLHDSIPVNVLQCVECVAVWCSVLQSVAVCCSVLQCVEYTCICVCIECHGSQCAVALDKNTLFTRVCLRVRMHIQVYMFICVCLYIIQSVRRIVV